MSLGSRLGRGPWLVLGAALAASACDSRAEGLLLPDAGEDEGQGEPQRPDAGKKDSAPPDVSPMLPDAAAPDVSPATPPMAEPTPPTPEPTPPTPPGRFCSFGRVTPGQVSANLLLLMDRSGSMRVNVSGTSQSRWSAMTEAVDLIVKKTATAVNWGLKYFPTQNSCDVNDGAEVPVSASNYDRVVGMVRSTQPHPSTGQPGTPIHAAIRKGAAHLMSAGGVTPKFLVLASDGEPTCPAGDAGYREALAAVRDAAAAGVRTFVLGISAGPTAHNMMNELAVAGREPHANATKYYAVSNQQHIQEALEHITQRLTKCIYTVDVPPPAPNFVALEIDGRRIPRDTNQANGWNWGGNYQSIQVYGAACDALRAQAPKKVDLILGCEGISPP